MVFSYADCWFSHDAAHLCLWLLPRSDKNQTNIEIFDLEIRFSYCNGNEIKHEKIKISSQLEVLKALGEVLD